LQRRLRRLAVERIERGVAESQKRHCGIDGKTQRLLSQFRGRRPKTIHELPRTGTRIWIAALGRRLFQQGPGELHGLHTTTQGIIQTRRLQLFVPGTIVRWKRCQHQQGSNGRRGTEHGQGGSVDTPGGSTSWRTSRRNRRCQG